MFINIVFRIGNELMISSSAVYLLFFPMDQSRDVTHCFGGGGMIFHFRLFGSIVFCCLNFIVFFHLLYRLTCSVYYYCN